jgi:hypothetical protein
LLLVSHEAYSIGMPLWVTFPFDPTVPDSQPEVLARVMRCNQKSENGESLSDVALHFESTLQPSIPGDGAKKTVAKAGPRVENEWRNLSTPINVRLRQVPWFEEAMTIQVSPDSLRFVSNREYADGDALLISFVSPTASPWSGQPEQPARVVSVQRISGSNSVFVTAKKASS